MRSLKERLLPESRVTLRKQEARKQEIFEQYTRLTLAERAFFLVEEHLSQSEDTDSEKIFHDLKERLDDACDESLQKCLRDYLEIYCKDLIATRKAYDLLKQESIRRGGSGSPEDIAEDMFPDHPHVPSSDAMHGVTLERGFLLLETAYPLNTLFRRYNEGTHGLFFNDISKKSFSPQFLRDIGKIPMVVVNTSLGSSFATLLHEWQYYRTELYLRVFSQNLHKSDVF